MLIPVYCPELNFYATLDTEDFVDIPPRGGRHYRLVEHGAFAKASEVIGLTVENQADLDMWCLPEIETHK